MRKTTFSVTDEPRDDYLLDTLRCNACGGEFVFYTDENVTDTEDTPKFCPLCGVERERTTTPS